MTKPFSIEEKRAIVREIAKSTIQKVSKKYGVAVSTIYSWKKQFAIKKFHRALDHEAECIVHTKKKSKKAIKKIPTLEVKDAFIKQLTDTVFCLQKMIKILKQK